MSASRKFGFVGFVLLMVLSFVLSIATFFVNTPSASALNLDAGCHVIQIPGYKKVDCAIIKKGFPDFNPQEGKCYVSWDNGIFVTPPIRLVTCNSTDPNLVPPPNSPPRLPFNMIPGAPEQVNINLSEVNCFVPDSEQGYRKTTCPPNDKPPGCYVINTGVGDLGGVSTVGQPIECNTIQNVVIEGIQNDQQGEYKPQLANADTCGAPDQAPVNTSINIGCQGKGNPIVDMVLAITRFLSAGAGIICIASMIVGAIQFTASGGNPKATSDAVKRMASSAGALVFFLFIYAILNWIVPGGLL